MLKSRSYIAIPPGETIKEQMVDKHLDEKEFAIRMGMSEKYIRGLIDGEVQLTPEVASRLDAVLGPSSSFWNYLEAIYRDKIIKVEAENVEFLYAEIKEYK